MDSRIVPMTRAFPCKIPWKHITKYTHRSIIKKSQIKILFRLFFLGENQYEVDVYATFTSQASLNE